MRPATSARSRTRCRCPGSRYPHGDKGLSGSRHVRPARHFNHLADRPYPHSVDVKLHAFPSRDREFVDFALAAWAVLPEPRSTDALQRALRVRYPAAVVTEQEDLARHGDGPTIWYAFRTAAIGAPAVEVPPARSGAWAIIDDERRFVEVSA